MWSLMSLFTSSADLLMGVRFIMVAQDCDQFEAFENICLDRGEG